MEGSHSGLVRRFRKPIKAQAFRGFDSHPFRQEKKLLTNKNMAQIFEYDKRVKSRFGPIYLALMFLGLLLLLLFVANRYALSKNTIIELVVIIFVFLGVAFIFLIFPQGYIEIDGINLNKKIFGQNLWSIQISTITEISPHNRWEQRMAGKHRIGLIIKTNKFYSIARDVESMDSFINQLMQINPQIKNYSALAGTNNLTSSYMFHRIKQSAFILIIITIIIYIFHKL
jgi:hypothetical protein